MFRLIGECNPAVVFGEQVASKAGRLWLARVRADMETLAHAFGAADLCAAGISAPMVSQRLHWVATPVRAERRESSEGREDVAHGTDSGREEAPGGSSICSAHPPGVAAPNGYHSHWWSGALQVGRNCIAGEIERGGRKYRAQWRIKPGLSLLADGIPGRVAQLCGLGNAIVPQLAAEFIGAYLDLDLIEA
jgi:DNA (cytosine-5)-methyltransferase 1